MNSSNCDSKNNKLSINTKKRTIEIENVPRLTRSSFKKCLNSDVISSPKTEDIKSKTKNLFNSQELKVWKKFIFYAKFVILRVNWNVYRI